MEHGVLTVFRFSQQMEQYFATICETMEGYGDFEAEALAFKVSIYQTRLDSSRAYKVSSAAREAERGKEHGWFTSG